MNTNIAIWYFLFDFRHCWVNKLKHIYFLIEVYILAQQLVNEHLYCFSGLGILVYKSFCNN